MFDNILKAYLKICEYSRNNQQSYDDAFLNQLQQRFRFCRLSYQNSLSILFSRCKISLCQRNTHDVSSLLALGKIVAASQHKRQPKKSLSRLTIENTDSDLKVHALHYANELLKNFCKLRSQTNRNDKKLLKTGFGYD